MPIGDYNYLQCTLTTYSNQTNRLFHQNTTCSPLQIFRPSYDPGTGHWPVHQQEASKPFDTWVEQSVILTLLRWPINHPIVFGCPPVLQNENLMWAKTDYCDWLTPGFHVQMNNKLQVCRNSFKVGRDKGSNLEQFWKSLTWSEHFKKSVVLEAIFIIICQSW